MEGRWILTDLEYQINKLNTKLEAIEAHLSQLKDRSRDIQALHDELVEDKGSIKAELRLLCAQLALTEKTPY